MDPTADSTKTSPAHDVASMTRDLLWRLLRLLAKDVARELGQDEKDQDRPTPSVP